MRKSLHSAIAVAAAALLFTLLSAVPATAATSINYVALGDSYSAGVGTRDSQNDCYQSPYGYPALVAAQYGLTLDYQACKGATTADVQTDQLGALNSATAAVSMTIGGNDAGFKSVIITCALPSWLSNCSGRVDQGLAVVHNDLPGRYDTLFSMIRSRAPHATVVIGDYPLIFQGEDCNAGTFFSPTDESEINSATGELDDLIKAKAQAYGFRFVEARPAFTGHAICDDVEWINGLSDPLTESFHPNRDGNIGYATLFGPALTGRPLPAAGMQSALLTARQSAIPQQSAADQAGSVLALHLDSPANLAKARRQGISPARIRSLVKLLRTGNQTKINSALTGLRSLDQHVRMQPVGLAGRTPATSDPRSDEDQQPG